MGADARERYDSALAGVWGDLGRTLSRLESLAAEPDYLDESALDVLPHLQYSLHRAGELTAGIRPPSGHEGAHEELAAALEDARDLTADAADALEAGGGAAVAVLVHEWRGALFRVAAAEDCWGHDGFWGAVAIHCPKSGVTVAATINTSPFGLTPGSEVDPFEAPAIEAALRSMAERLELKPRDAFQPIRIAVTGSKISPGLFESLELLGKEEALARLAAYGR